MEVRILLGIQNKKHTSDMYADEKTIIVGAGGVSVFQFGWVAELADAPHQGCGFSVGSTPTPATQIN